MMEAAKEKRSFVSLAHYPGGGSVTLQLPLHNLPFSSIFAISFLSLLHLRAR